MKPPRFYNLTLGTLGVAALAGPLVLGGCVSSRAAAYRAHLDARVESGRSTSPEVAVAFGLDGFGATDERLAAAAGDSRLQP